MQQLVVMPRDTDAVGMTRTDAIFPRTGQKRRRK
jgi:hypothetical protein